jgi:hypothetical protein
MTGSHEHRRITFVGSVLAALALLFSAAAGVAKASTATWYVAPGGSDLSSCAAPTEPCATINGAVEKANTGDTIRVAVGTYTGSTADAVVSIDESVSLEGGWDAAFVSRPGVSTIDGQSSRRGVHVVGAQVRIERFVVENGGGPSSSPGGGGISVVTTATAGAELELDSSTVRNSTPGGIWSDGRLTITSSTISGNSNNGSATGGGVTAAFGAPLTITNSTITENTHTSQGAGILALAPIVGSSTVQLSNTTIVGNHAGFSGGGVRVEHDVTVHVRNSIVAGNTAGSFGSDFSLDVRATVVSEGYNVGTGFTPTTGDVFTGDPLMGGLADNGGPTETLAPLFASPAIDGGNPDGCRDESGAPLASDQRGVVRPAGAACDVGAVEVEPPSNDDFADATSLDGMPQPLSASNEYATEEPGEPDHAGNQGGASLWYSWAPSFTGTAFVSTVGSDFDTLVAVYTGPAVANLTLHAASDDANAGAGPSRACFEATAGTTYRIAVDGWSPGVPEFFSRGNVALTWGPYASDAPCAVLPPTVVGTPRVGETLTATTGTWAGSPSRFTYRWLACDFDGCFSISGATKPTYTPPEEAVGYRLQVRVIAEHAFDPELDAIGYSAPTEPVADAPGGGGGGGGGGALLADVKLTGSVAPASAPVGSTLVWRLRVETVNKGAAFGLHVDVTLPAGVALVSTAADRGPGCSATGTLRLRCNLDFLSGDAPVGNVVLTTTATQPGDHLLTATAAYEHADPTPADNTVTLRATTPTPPVQPVPRPGCPGIARAGTPAANRLVGTPCPDTLRGMGGSDRLFGLAGADTLYGGPGADRLYGAGGNDRLFGGSGADRLFGGGGADRLDGGAGRDLLDGGSGGDSILARDGARDTVRCGGGNDAVTADRSDRIARDCERVARR